MGYRLGGGVSKASPGTRLTFATVGWLLLKLVGLASEQSSADGDDVLLSSGAAPSAGFEYSHVVVDEVCPLTSPLPAWRVWAHSSSVGPTTPQLFARGKFGLCHLGASLAHGDF